MSDQGAEVSTLLKTLLSEIQQGKPRKLSDEDRLTRCREFNYHNPRILEDGKIIAVLNLMWSSALAVDIDVSSGIYQRRYCYERDVDAFVACNTWDGKGDPPGDWVTEKPGDRQGPGAMR